MATQNTATTEAQAVIDHASCYQAIPCADGYLNWTEKFEGVAWSVGFRLAWLIVVTVMAPVKLLTGGRTAEATRVPLQCYPLTRN